MIPRDTVDRIIDAAHVEEVVGEFVTLKKRGTNLLGLCPFHGEKTPSFTVSPTKGIFKCFGCGKAGSSVNFVMEHLKLTYPEALRWLAKKYNIDIVEKEITPEDLEKQTERESLFIVMQYAQRYFTEQMLTTDEGKSIGLGYFQERGLQPAIIEKFQLGYSPESRNAFTKAAVKAGYQPKYLSASGMSIVRNGTDEKKELAEGDLFDRFAGRVMFPVLDEAGRVVAFGGRTLSSDKKTAKYINSPETDIYHKSRVLYGLWYAKRAIQNADTCYLVEGYMDVIAMHQAGVENVVASSGTSLTIEQIKSIHRFTKNIVVLYDGDEAGQKASMRAIPMLLEEGMNVRLLMFPDNDDPDSFSRKVGAEEFQNYLRENSQDFLFFRAERLKTISSGDPIKRAGLIRELVENIALIPDNIIRSVYIRQCAIIMEMEEQILQNEVNKLRRNLASKIKLRSGDVDESKPSSEEESAEAIESFEKQNTEELVPDYDHEEIELLRIMMQFGNVYIEIEGEDEETSESHKIDIPASDYILFELYRDEMTFENPMHTAVLDEYIHEYKNSHFPTAQQFLNSTNPIVNQFVLKHVLNSREVSLKWKHFGVEVPEEVNNLKRGIEHVLFSYKEKKLRAYIQEKQKLLKTTEEPEIWDLLRELDDLKKVKSRLNKHLGRTVVK
ncbi:MAG: DNA primase [Bacteroidia bacterium]|jgi:DNA primase|nr:DNA primase [Bacteroidia bacterium]